MNTQIQIMLQQAVKAFENGYFERAESILKKILQVDSKNFSALNILGLIKLMQANYKEATDYLKKAAHIKPNDPAIQYNLAKSLHDVGCLRDSIPHHKKAVELAPNNPKAWLNYGITLSNLCQDKEALVCFDQVLKLAPDYVEGCINNGNALHQIKHYEEALSNYDLALMLRPDFADAWFNKGNTLMELKYFDEAITHYEKALSLRPQDAVALFYKGVALNELKKYDEAIKYFNKAISIKEDISWALGSLLHVKMKICDWSNFDNNLDFFYRDLMINKKISLPFPCTTFTDHVFLQKKCAEIFVESIYPTNNYLGIISKNFIRKKIRVGYFSADFHNHATGYLMAELFELHDKNKFEIVGFSFGSTSNDEIRQRLTKSFDQFIEVGTKSDIEITKISRDLNIDIAVDLKGFTQDAKTGIFAHRAAPIQVNYLGYPGTMGADYIDYIIADKILIPTEFQSGYSERVVYLPNSYQVNDRKRLISERQFTRQEMGLPEDSFVFCCFNNNFKILPKTFASWMKILNAVEGSVLWLFQDNPWVADNLRSEAKKYGVTADRLIFANRLPLTEHLARHRQADLFLDTFPYNAHTTASDALWSGLPVLTLMGQSFASRVAASLLTAIGLSELITSTQEEYEALAIELANSSQRLADLKQKLANNRLTTPLFDTPLFTKNLEAAYIQMYQRYQTGLEPDHILIGQI